MANMGDLVNNYSLKSNTAGAEGAKLALEAKAQAEKDARDSALKQLLLGTQGQQKLDEIGATHAADLDSQDKAITRAKDLQTDLSTGHPGHKYNIGVSKEGVTLGESDTDPYAKAAAGAANRISMQTARIAKEGKSLDPLSHQMETLNLYHQMLDDPNSFDQKKLQVLGARLVEGSGQRLLDSVIQTMGGSKQTLAGDAQSKLNYLMGRTQAGLTDDQVKAMRDTALKYQDEMMPQWEAGSQRFKAYAPSLGPEVPNVDALVQASLGEGTRLQQELATRKQKILEAKKALAEAPASTFAQGGPSQGAPASFADKLTNWLKGKSGGAMASPAAPMQQQQPQGGAATIRVKHLATGQTGTIPASEFDPSVYQQVK